MFVGINLAPTFSRRATHLLCPSGTGLKFEKACQWGIPVVNDHWLVKMVESGEIPGLDGFLVSAPTCDLQTPEVPIAVDRMVLDEENSDDKKDLKGKGRAIEKGEGRARRDQGIDDEEGDPGMRVPSSKSPSPMKSLKNISRSSSRLSISPVKIDHEATKALQETISSLLGKRPTPEGEDLAGVADVPNGRNGKRARPHRSRVS